MKDLHQPLSSGIHASAFSVWGALDPKVQSVQAIHVGAGMLRARYAEGGERGSEKKSIFICRFLLVIPFCSH